MQARFACGGPAQIIQTCDRQHFKDDDQTIGEIEAALANACGVRRR